MGSTSKDVNIEQLQFVYAGIKLVDNWHGNNYAQRINISNNWFRDMTWDDAPYPNMVFTTAGGIADSTIINNKFTNIHGDNGIFLQQQTINFNIRIANNTFIDVNEGIHIFLEPTLPGAGDDIVIEDNVIRTVRRMGIEVQGTQSSALIVQRNKVSDFYSRDNSTFGISVVPRGERVFGTQVRYNEISATRTPDNHSGNTDTDPGPRTSVEVQIGIEAAGGTSTIDSNCRVHHNIIHGCFVGISMETSRNLHVYDNYIWNGEGGIHNAHATLPRGEADDPLVPEVDNDIDQQHSGVQMIADDLFIGGGNADDVIDIAKSDNNIIVEVNDVTVYNAAAPSGFILAYGYGGNDTFTVSGGITQQVVAEGGAGTDTLHFVAPDDSARLYSFNTVNYTFQTDQGTVGLASWIDTEVMTTDLGTIIFRGGEGIELTAGDGTDTIAVGNNDVNLAVSPNRVTLSGSGGGDSISINTDNNRSAEVVLGNTQVISALNIGTGGKLDLNDNDVILNYTGENPVAAIRGWLITGRNSGAWNGNGIMSSAAAGNSATALGYLDNGDILTPLTSFEGYTIDVTTLLIKYTYGGDADLNGMVDVADLGILASNWQLPEAKWYRADFDYSGFVDVADLGILASNWQAGVSSPSEETFNEAWYRIRHGGRPGPDSESAEDAYESIAAELGLSAEDLAAILAVWGANAGGPAL